MAVATLTSKGQITIPVAVRRKLGVTTGDRLEFVETADGQFFLVPALSDVRALRGIVPAPKRPVTIAQMRRIVARRGAGK